MDTLPHLDLDRSARMHAQWGRLDHAESLLQECLQASYDYPHDFPPVTLESLRVAVARVRDELMERIDGAGQSRGDSDVGT